MNWLPFFVVLAQVRKHGTFLIGGRAEPWSLFVCIARNATVPRCHRPFCTPGHSGPFEAGSNHLQLIFAQVKFN